MGARQREFIRHPVDIPIAVRKRNDSAGHCQGMHNLSLGGLSFDSDQAWVEGEEITISLTVPFNLEISGRVVWCHRHGHRYDVGLTFGSQAEAYKGRMIEQICHIEQYRRDRERHTGSSVSLEEAAREWINQFADRFAQEGWKEDEAGPEIQQRRPRDPH